MKIKLNKFRAILLVAACLIPATQFASPVLAKPFCQNNTAFDIKTDFMQKLSKKLDYGKIIFAACKPSPIHIGQTYAVLITRRVQQLCLNVCNYNLIFLIASNSGNTIRQLYVKENALRLNARSIKNVTIDTGLYQLSPSLRAAGIRIEKRKPAYFFKICLNELYLFIEDGKTFKPLFHNEDERHSQKLFALRMNEVEKSKQLLGIGSHSCNTYRSEAARTIAFGDYHNGLRDLVIKSKITDISTIKEKNSCTEQEIATTSGQTVIPYDGLYYRLPDWLSD